MATSAAASEDPASRGRDTFARLSDVVLAAAAERSLIGTLRRLVNGARMLTGARYAALGVPDETGTAFRHFLHVGMPPDVVSELGPLPRTHGLLGAMLSDARSYRTTDITSDPRFGGWPPAHPPMRHFLGVPLLTGGTIVGAFYLTGEADDPPFADRDHELMSVLAAHAAVAVDNARLLEASRRTAIAEERARLSRELHDAVAQNVFGLRLTARSAARRVRDDPEGVSRDLARIEQLAGAALHELSTAIDQLQPPELDRDGLARVVQAHADLVSRGHQLSVELRADPPADDDRWRTVQNVTAAAVLRIVQEALANAARHSGVKQVDVALRYADGTVTATVSDAGKGFATEVGEGRAEGLGLVSMGERAAAIGATLSITSSPNQGTRVSVTAAASRSPGSRR